MLLLIGDRSGNIIRGVWVHFDDCLLQDYGIVLKYIYEHALSWAYDPYEISLPKEEIVQVLDNHKTINLETFLGYFYLWRYVSTKLPLPIPKLERIIPFVMSQWNAIKGGSDTITKLLWLNIYGPPCNTPQSHAIARMLLIGNVIVHRLNHFFTAKSDLDLSYPSLKHFRNAASKRSSFHDTLLLIVHAIKSRDLLPPILIPSLPVVTEGVHTRRTDTTMKAVAWGAMSIGATPHKQVKKWYLSDPTTFQDLSVHERMRNCLGVPVYRVDMKTKDNKGRGSRSNCAECGRITNTFCIKCKTWLCNPQLAANRGSDKENSVGLNEMDPKFIMIQFDDGRTIEKKETICAIFSCWHKFHQAALEADGALARGWLLGDDCSSLTNSI